MKNIFKVIIKDEAHSEAVQKIMFKMGYFWSSGGESHVVDYLDKEVLYAEADGSLAYSTLRYAEEDEQHHYPSMELSTTLVTVKEPERISVDKGRYTREQLEAILEGMD